MGLFDFMRKKQPAIQTTAAASIEAEIIVQLEALGYFKYAAPEDITVLQEELEDSLKRFNYLSSLYFDKKPYHSKEYRHFVLDGEDLFEQDGFTDKLKDMQLLFDKMEVKMAVTSHVEECDDAGRLNHSIGINGKEYIIFRNFTERGWGEAAQRFAEIINDQLILQGKDERLYLSNAGNDGNAIFLTAQQLDVLDPVLKNKRDRPLKVEDWCRLMEVDMNNYMQ